jgi:predicted Zn-dependent peptidase
MLKPIVLKNGLTVLRFPRTSSNIFLAGFVATTGSSVEEGYFPQGISKLIEQMFWDGTDKHPSARSLNLALESIGGHFYTQTGRETSQYYLTVPSNHRHRAVSILAEIMQHSYFDERDLENEKKNQVERFKQTVEDFETEARYLSMANLYQHSPIGQPVEGTVDSILSIEREDILEYLAHQYRPDKSFLVLAGNFESKSIMELVDQEWTFWNPRTKRFIEPMPFTQEDWGQLPRLNYRQRGIPKTALVLNFVLDAGLQPIELLAPTSDDPETEPPDTQKLLDDMLTKWARLLVLNCILGQGFSSRLWSKGVEEEMFFDKVGSELVMFRSTGFLEISGICDNSQFTFALESVLSVLESLKKTTVSINELAKAKEYLKGQLILAQEDLLTSVIWQIDHLIGSGLTFELSDLIAKIDQVEAPPLRAEASDLFVTSRMVLTTLGTAKETRLVDKLLRKYLS